MPISTWEHQGEGQDLFKRQKCHDGVPISTRYEVSTITTYYASYSYYSPPHSTELPPKTSRPPPTSRIHFTLKTPRPQISIPETSTTRLPPKKSVVSTASDTILKARAPNSVPVTITRTIVTRVPVETIYSCPPPSSREPLTTRHAGPTSPRTSRAPPSSREPPTSFSREPSSWVEPTSRSNRELPTSWRSNTTEPTASPSTSRSSISSGGPWYPTSSTPSTPSSGHRPTGPPSTSLSPSTRTTSTIPVPTSAPNSTVTWPPISTQSYSDVLHGLNLERIVVYFGLQQRSMGHRSLRFHVYEYIRHDLDLDLDPDPDQYNYFNSDYHLVAVQFLCSGLGNVGWCAMHLVDQRDLVYMVV
ncbi:hypothetical protein OPQ81_008863 [Rhizoctonia solani]|nr:hypothetical protein OPQ81_008863 [Rhizoctonia solani]